MTSRLIRMPFVVDVANSDVQGQRVGIVGLVRPNADVEHVEHRLGTFAGQPDWFRARLDENALDRVGDLTRSLDALCAKLAGSLSAEAFAGYGRCRLVQRVKLARDVEDDVHATKASPR